MVKELLDAILANENVRQNLSSLRQIIRDGQKRHALLYQLTGHEEQIIAFLGHEDAKTRKNAALLMGELGQTIYLEPLIEAYKKETTLFVRSSYLTAIAQLDYRKYMKEFKEQLKLLDETPLTEDNRKHIAAEKKALQEMILTMEAPSSHNFTGLKREEQMVLLTNRNHIDTVISQLEGIPAKGFNAGVIVKTQDIEQILALRTYEELLFMLPGMGPSVMDVKEAAKTIVTPTLQRFLTETHKGKVPFYFRIEVKSKMDLSKRSTFAKRLAQEIESLSGGWLRNSTSHYEIEIRLIENKEGKCNILLKLYTIPDRRFAYRIETLPTSIKPVNAALAVELAKPYMKEEAQVLDPFCGVGTMLIERYKAVKANTTYGIDYFGEAIEKAKCNTEAAHQIIHYIQRDFFDFTHEYLFDEIITQLPWAIGRTTETEIRELYVHFFKKAKLHLTEEGVLILYTHNKELVESIGKREGYVIIKKFEINAKEGTYVYVLGR